MGIEKLFEFEMKKFKFKMKNRLFKKRFQNKSLFNRYGVQAF